MKVHRSFIKTHLIKTEKPGRCQETEERDKRDSRFVANGLTVSINKVNLFVE